MMLIIDLTAISIILKAQIPAQSVLYLIKFESLRN